jgi:hypothetical protein
MSRNIAALVALAFVGRALGNPMPQAVTESIAPEAATPSECTGTGPGPFNLSPVDASDSGSEGTAQRRVLRRGAIRNRAGGDVDGILECKLKDSILKDQADRIGYIASNYQYVQNPYLGD